MNTRHFNASRNGNLALTVLNKRDRMRRQGAKRFANAQAFQVENSSKTTKPSF